MQEHFCQYSRNKLKENPTQIIQRHEASPSDVDVYV
jgi:hypothetical protein